jgi:LPPG:FO 2-phospho-L-lactate transferase
MITALAGGIGASKLLLGLTHVIPPQTLSIVTNTGDDIELHGLYISPDIDTVTYTLAGVINADTGWGIAGDTFHCLEGLKSLGAEHWFNLGDRDLATHIWRTQLLRQGATLSEVTKRLGLSLGVEARVIPMTDTYVPTRIVSDEGTLHFQEYLIKRRTEPRVKEIYFENISTASPAPGVIPALTAAEIIVICPSNPLISIGPILAVPGIREALRQTKARIVAVSPLVGGAALKGPTDRMLADLGREVSALEVARMYQDFIDVYVIDHEDEKLRSSIETLGLQVAVTQTVMCDLVDKIDLAKIVVDIGR